MTGPAKQPDDPFTALLAGAVQLHELYSTYVAAGFTADQAYGLTVVTLTEALRHSGPCGA